MEKKKGIKKKGMQQHDLVIPAVQTDYRLKGAVWTHAR